MSDDVKWKLKYRTPGGRGIWCRILDDEDNLRIWQMASDKTPPQSTGGYSNMHQLLHVHGVPDCALIEVHP